MGESYFKKDYSKVAVDVFEISQKRLQKIKKNVAITRFCCLVSKIWKTIVFFILL